jgi:hypothetical protein
LSLAQAAEKELRKAGAAVKPVEVEGGHVWRGPLDDNIRDGIHWMEKNHAAPAWP